MIAREDDHRVVRRAAPLEALHQPAERRISLLHHGGIDRVVLHRLGNTLTVTEEVGIISPTADRPAGLAEFSLILFRELRRRFQRRVHRVV